MAGKKKTMGRGLGSLLDRRTTSSNATHATPPSTPKNDSSGPTALSNSAKSDSFASSSTAPDGSNSDSSADSEAPASQDTVNTGSAVDISAEPTTGSFVGSGDKLRLLGIDQIQRGSYQPRRHFDAELLQELADSLKSEGLIQPILVRPAGDGGFELIAGERRWRAAQLAGLTEIPAIVRNLEDRSVAAVSLIENIQRKDLNPLEEAEALHRLCEEFGLSHQEVATSVGRSRSAVTNLMRLLDLHEDVKKLVDTGEIDMGHARALLGAPFDDQPALAKRIAKQGLTVRAVEHQIKALRNGTASTAVSQVVSDPDIDRLSKHLSEKFGASVSIRHKSSGAGKLEISYNTMDELDGILNHIK